MNATQLLAHFDRLAEAPNAVPRLRRFILDLAVRGKLVEQDAGDEPAAELLKRIEEEWACLGTGGHLKKKRHQSAAEEIPFAIPQQWEWVPLGRVTRIRTGKLDANAAVKGGAFPFFTCSQTPLEIATYSFDTAAVLLAGNGDFNLKCYEGKFDAYQRTYVIEPISWGVQYCFIVLRSQISRITENNRGSAIPYLKLGDISDPPVPLPPLAEQHRIVSKVDELMALCDQLEAAQQERERRRDRLAAASLQRLNQPALDAAPEAQREHARFHLHHLPSLTTRPELIKAIRKTLLNLAVKGRFASQNSDDEPGVVLLKRLHKARDSLVTAKRLRASKDALPVEAVELPFDLPAGWVRTRLGQVYDVRDGTHDTPKYVDVGYPLITSKNLSSGGLTFQDVKLISEADHRQISERSAVARNDVLLAMIGSIGNPVIVDTDRPFSIKNVALFKCFDMELSSPRFLCLYLQHATDVMRDLATGGLQPFVSLGFLRNFPVALPPLAEQHRIVAKVDELMALCDQLEAQLTTTQTNSRRLLEAVLEEALIPVN